MLNSTLEITFDDITVKSTQFSLGLSPGSLSELCTNIDATSIPSSYFQSSENNMTLKVQARNIFGKPALNYSGNIHFLLLAIQIWYYIYNTTTSISTSPSFYLKYASANNYARVTPDSNATGVIENLQVIYFNIWLVWISSKKRA